MPQGADAGRADQAAWPTAGAEPLAHDPRLPLSLLGSLVQLMRREELDATLLGQVAAIEQMVRHLAGQLDAALGRSAEANPSPPPSDAPLAPAAVLADAAQMLRPLALARGLTVDVQASPQATDRAWRGDPAALRQALLHAGRFALGASAPGVLRLRCQAEAADQPDGTRRLRLEVDFAGARPGFDLTALADQDVDLLGLRSLAAHLQGDTGLQPAPAGRWCCWFTAPVQHTPFDPTHQPQGSELAPAGPATAALSDRLRQRHAGRRVLVVEDDKVNQMVMLELLGDVGLLADTADDGLEALERVASRTYALVAMDLRMPRLDGLGATRALRAMPALARTPIVAVTANAFDEDRAACRVAGMNDFVPKPIDVDRLYAVLLHWLDRSPDGLVSGSGEAGAALQPAPAAQAAPPAPVVSAAAHRLPPPAGVDDALLPLLGLEGVDAMGGLGSVGGRVATYLRLLGVFIDAHQHDGQALRDLVQDQQAEAAGRLAHRLRGSAATLGLVDVETAAAGLEHAIDRGDAGASLAPLSEAVWQALGATVPALRAALAR
jgi:two-component system, sensor histidine kinase and response regulator